MHLEEKSPARNRRIYALADDLDIYKHLGKYTLLTCEQLARLTGRKFGVIQHRMEPLFDANHVNREREDLFHPFVYWLGRHGSRIAWEQGFIDEPKWTPKRSPKMLPHDLPLTEIHFALDPIVVKWEQRRDWLKITVPVQPWDKKSVKHNLRHKAIVPDVFFKTARDGFIIEHVKAQPSSYEGDSDVEIKMMYYETPEFREELRRKFGVQDFRVLWVYPVESRIRNILEKTEGMSRRHWFTDLPTLLDRPADSIFWTPFDFRERTHSIPAHDSVNLT